MAFAAGALYAAASAYGYWHAATHATFNVHLAYRTETGTVNRMHNGQLAFLDSEGEVLARATIDARRNVVWLAHPEHGQCGPELSNEAHRACIQMQALWIPTWAERVRHANLALAHCSLARRPVSLNASRDSLLFWWLPTRSNGLPYKRYHVVIAVDTRGCN